MAAALDPPPALGQEQQRYRVSLWHALIAVQQAHFGHASQDVKLALCRRMAAAYGSELQAHHDARVTKVLGRRLDFLLLERFFRCIVNVLAQQQHHLDFVLEGADEEHAEAGSSAAGSAEAEPRVQALSIVMASNTVMLEFGFTPKLNDSLQSDSGDLMAAYTCPIQVSVEVDSEDEADQTQATFLCERIKTCLAQQDFGLLQMVLTNFFEQKLVAESAESDAATPQDSDRMVDDGLLPAGQARAGGGPPLVSAVAIREAVAADPVLAGCPELRLLQPLGSGPAAGLGAAAQPELVFARSRLAWAPYDFVVQATSRRSLQFWPPLVVCSRTLAMGLGPSCAASVTRVPPPFDLDFSGVSRRPALSSRPLGPECFAVCAARPAADQAIAGHQFVRDCSGSDLASGVVLGFFARDTWFSQTECVERLEFPANAQLPAGWFPSLIRCLRRQLTFNALVQPMFRSPAAEGGSSDPLSSALLAASGSPGPGWSFSLSAQPPLCVLVAARQASTGRRWVCEFRILDELAVAAGGAAEVPPGLQLAAAQSLRANPFAGSLCNRVAVRISGYPREAADAGGSPADDRLSKLAERVLSLTCSLPQALKHTFVHGPMSRKSEQ